MTERDHNYLPVNIGANSEDLGSFTDEKRVWKVSSLICHVKEQKLKIFDLPLCALDLERSVWGESMSIMVFAEHWKRAAAISLEYPVILSAGGFIMDGWHRVAKALFLELSTIPAVRFNQTPECDFVQTE